MRAIPNRTQVIRFGLFEVDLAAGEIRKAGMRQKLAGQSFLVLTALLERPQEVVTRDELRARLWPDNTFVDYELGLKKAINRLRDVLGDSAENPRFIETVPRRGYRFIGLTRPEFRHHNSRSEYEVTQTKGTSPQQERVGGHSRFLAATAGTILFAVTAVFGYIHLRHSRLPQILRYAQVTRDSEAKTSSYMSELLSPMVSDGSQLYFMAGPLGNKRLMQVSTSGGETSSFIAPLEIRRIVAASASRHELLVLSSGGDALPLESPLIVLPLPAGAPHRVGDILAHDASWSTDGTRIVFANGHELYVAKSDGTESRTIASLPNSAWWPRWSPDGQVVRFTVLNELGGGSLWEASSEGGHLRRLFAEEAEPLFQCCGNWTADGKYFVFASTLGSESQLWTVREGGNLGHAHELTRLSNGPMSLFAPLPGTDGKRLFAVATQTRGQLVRYDARVGQFLPFLSGISAEGVDFSADGQWVTYVSVPDRILWRSKADGSERRQLTLPPMDVRLPRWSPDGNHIAFLGQAAVGKPLKIYLISPEGGTPEQAIAGDANEGEPSWSPDGHSIAFGPLVGMERARAHVALLDLRTRELRSLPESQGFFSARWSPDGRYIAALTFDESQTLTLFDLETHKRMELIDRAAYPNWSHDGRHIYFVRPYSDDPGLYRVRVPDGKVEKITTLNPGLLSWAIVGKWTGLAPDGSPLVLRDTSVEEVYALDWQVP
jgi:Tol biopolymer transport system component/DNA-binding winged helix-turn-helix (wHTH) protein